MRTRYFAQCLRLRAAFHTLPLFCYERKIYVCTLRVDFHCRVIFTCVNSVCVNEIEAMYERSCVNVKVEPRSTFTLTRDRPYIASILFTRVKFA